MRKIFSQPFCLIDLSKQSDYLSLFEKEEDFEIYQLRMGLKALCHNTLVYPVFKDGKLEYRETVSPHALDFYHRECREHCTGKVGSRNCDCCLKEITKWFCEGRAEDYLEHIGAQCIPYQPDKPDEIYIRYPCPFFPQFIKFGFPIYVNGTVVAVLFTGQFSVGDMGSLSGRRDGALPVFLENNRHFRTEEDLRVFVQSSLLNIVGDFALQARKNLHTRQEDQLEALLEECVDRMEEQTTEFLRSMPDRLIKGENETVMRDEFWKLVEQNLHPYLEQIGVEKLLLFISEQDTQKASPQIVQGIRLYPELSQREPDKFNFQKARDYQKDSPDQTKEGRTALNATWYATTFGMHSQDVMFLRDWFTLADLDDHKKNDLMVHMEKVQPFAVCLNYTDDTILSRQGFTFRRKILGQLKDFFLKVGQELAYFSIRISEHTTKTVLRIYRHEITHQIQVLEQNNWFMDINRLKQFNEDKLQLIADDQYQCLAELDFMTQNIDAVTGRIYSRVSNLGKDADIDVRVDLLNKVKSLYARRAREKILWFVTQNQSRSTFLKSKLAMVDLIIFNLMNNAIKYSHHGTNVIIKFDDTHIFGRPHRISITDFGVEARAEYPAQVFQMYYRGYVGSQIEGSGIGLYVAHTVAEILGAELNWKCDPISDYNVPVLVRYIDLPKDDREKLAVDYGKARAEYDRLVEEAQLNRVFNNEYHLSDPSRWSRLEIEEEMMQPTYEVTFTLEL